MSVVVLGREHWYAAVARRWNRAWGDPADETPVIYLRQVSGPGTWVVVEPDRGIRSSYFHAHSDALVQARKLQVMHGWEIFAAPAEGAI